MRPRIKLCELKEDDPPECCPEVSIEDGVDDGIEGGAEVA
jgi:hypothetical protein